MLGGRAARVRVKGEGLLRGGRGRSSSRRLAAVRFAAVGCAASLLLSACGGSGASGNDGGKVTLSFANWAITEEHTRPKLKKAIARFEKQHPKIDIKPVGISFSDIAHQVLLQAQSGNAPCIAEMAGNYTLSLSDAGLLKPLGEYAGQKFSQSIIPRELQLGKVDGELVAIPWTVAPFAFWYNKKVMKKAGLDPENPPQTIEELKSALAKVKSEAPDVIPFGIDTTNRVFGLDSSWPWMKAFGAQPFQSSKATADSAAMRDYLTFMRTLGKKNYTQINHKIGYFRQIAAKNNVAFMWDGPYLKGVIQTATGMSDEKFAKTWGVTSMPTGSSGQSYTVPTDHQLVMLNSCENPEQAWTFMNWLATSDYAVRKYTVPGESSLPPLDNPSGKTAKLLDTPIYESFYDEVVPTVQRPPWGETYANVYSPIMSGVQQAMTSSKPINSITARMQQQIQAELD